MTIVIDASVAVKWVLNEPRAAAAAALLAEELTAPEHWLAEAANALWRHVRLNELSAEEALLRIKELHSAPVAAVPIEADVVRALALGIELRHPVYDCLYLALAERQDTYVVTDDRRFFAAARAVDLENRLRLLEG